uniref:Late nodulin domain-containing protein n=2 Tax=Medicago truncatula TaxID=3880 RepID=I3T6I7_MEDTR|nr:unknown [Medicago truncatula]
MLKMKNMAQLIIFVYALIIFLYLLFVEAQITKLPCVTVDDCPKVEKPIPMVAKCFGKSFSRHCHYFYF